ncbi:peptide chain release factor 2 [bacterium]|nr:MAG: peptide chain release factor 2 [bacterium]
MLPVPRSYDCARSWSGCGCVFDYAKHRDRLKELERASQTSDFWEDAAAAQAVMKRIADLRAETEPLERVARTLDEAWELLELMGDEAGADEEAGRDTAAAAAELDGLEMAANFDREFDHHGAIVSINSGAGGTDAADWAQMLLRMYVRWAEHHGFEVRYSDETPGDEAGIKSATFFVRGRNAYGMLESERGVHRLVRISPFDAAHRRHTAFASVDVVPELEAGEGQLEIKPDEIRIETFKSGGAGGQYVNKTESAIRIIHLATGIIVSSQQERSQMQNRDVAMSILRAKLLQRELDERDRKLAELRGEKLSTEWGSQIRSYVLNPYQLVKDHRTGVETGNVTAVLDGEIDLFIWPYLQQRGRFAGSAVT